MEKIVKKGSVRERVTAEEWRVRVDLAAAYRLVALFGWDDLVFTHITAKVPNEEAFLINPYGLMFDEITATSLLKINLRGEKLLESEYDINPAGFLIHSCIHEARKDAACVLHTHSINGMAVSAQKNGLLPISQFASSVLFSLGYHDYEGFALNNDERPRLVADLGRNNCLLMRNHGLLTVGASVPSAFHWMHRLEAACMVQVRAQSGGSELIEVPSSILDIAQTQLQKTRLGKEPNQIVWPGLLRRLNKKNPGFEE